jgi:hypothetical protein
LPIRYSGAPSCWPPAILQPDTHNSNRIVTPSPARLQLTSAGAFAGCQPAKPFLSAGHHSGDRGSVKGSGHTSHKSDSVFCHCFWYNHSFKHLNCHQIRERNASSSKGDKVLRLLELGVLPLSFWGGGVRRVIFITFYLLRRTPPPHPRAGVPVWCGLRWLSIRPQARPKDMHMPFPPFTLPGMCMRLRVLPHGDRRKQSQVYSHLPDLVSSLQIHVWWYTNHVLGSYIPTWR